MYITHLSLTNFRNYGRLELEFPVGPTLLHGANAQGKTNLLEALYYLATARSPHADNDQQLINWEALHPEEPIIVGRLVTQVVANEGPKQIEMRLIREQQQGQLSFRREALIDQRKVRLMDLIGNLKVVLFLPQDVQLVTGSPANRRRYLNVTLCQTDPFYCRTLSAYNKVLEQRNAVLRRIAEQDIREDVLPVYTDKLVDLGSQVFVQRAKLIATLSQHAQRIHYEELTDGRESLRLSYLPRLMNASIRRGGEVTIEQAAEIGQWLHQQTNIETVKGRFRQLLSDVRQLELASGSTRVGPHRDDWQFWVSGRDLSSYGSRGQQRSAILALKLAEIGWMQEQTGETPLLLLDEVVAELDEQRRALMLKAIEDAKQAVLTATDPAMFTGNFLSKANTMSVSAGQLTQVAWHPPVT